MSCEKGSLIDSVFSCLNKHKNFYLSCNDIAKKTGAKKVSVQSALIRMREQNQVMFRKGINNSYIYKHRPVGAINPLAGFGIVKRANK